MSGKDIGATTGPVTAARADPTAVTAFAEGDGGVVSPRVGGRASINGEVLRLTPDMVGRNSSSGKSLSNILCCLCGRSIQPNGE